MRSMLSIGALFLLCNCQGLDEPHEPGLASGSNVEEGEPVQHGRPRASATPPELLLTNTINQDPTSPTYLAQLNALKVALRAGREVRISATFTDGSEYFSELVAGYFRADRINVVLPLQSYLNGHNVVSHLNGFFSEAINTLGTYNWGGYLFGTPNTTLTVAQGITAFAPNVTPNYVVKWYAETRAPQLLLRNTIPQNPSDPTYVAQLAVLKNALRQGRRIRVTMADSSGEYFTQIISGKLEVDRVTAMLPLRPNLTSEAMLASTNAIFGGSIDTLGNYWWGAYYFGSDTSSQSIFNFPPNITSGYVISWYAD